MNHHRCVELIDLFTTLPSPLSPAYSPIPLGEAVGLVYKHCPQCPSRCGTRNTFLLHSLPLIFSSILFSKPPHPLPSLILLSFLDVVYPSYFFVLLVYIILRSPDLLSTKGLKCPVPLPRLVACPCPGPWGVPPPPVGCCV